MNKLAAGPNTRITLHFSLALMNGELIESTFDKSPATFVWGDGNVPAGFEKKLLGLSAGETHTFLVHPEDAFGQPNPNNIQTFNRNQFDKNLVLEPGLVLSFADSSKSELPGVVVGFDEREVTVDFNHPLAGRDLKFEVDIISIEPAVSAVMPTAAQGHSPT